MSHEYLLGQANLAATRLHLQHELTKTNFDGNLLDPSIPTDNPDLRIADVACGTGVWALDLADRVPESVKIDCLDINFDEAPPEAWLPGNVRYQQCDLREPIREDLLGQYDILHVRYIVMFVLDPDFQIILAKLMSMLKPGGYIQWTDCNGRKFSWRTGDNNEDVPELRKLLELNTQILPAAPRTWIANMGTSFTEAGLTNVKFFEAEPKISTLQATTWNWLLSMHEVMDLVYSRYPEKRDLVDAWRKQIEKVNDEQRVLKTGMNMRMTRCVGRKQL